MAADQRALVKIGANGVEVVGVFREIEGAAAQTANKIKAANDAAFSAGGSMAQRLSDLSETARKNIAGLSFQLQDVAVGLQSGQSPLTVLLQQGTQVASIFGPGGAIVGAVGAGLGLVASYLFSAGDEAGKATAESYEFGQGLDFIAGVAGRTADELDKLITKYRQAGTEAQNVQRLALEGQRRQLEGELAAARTGALSALSDFPTLDTAGQQLGAKLGQFPPDVLERINAVARARKEIEGGAPLGSVVQDLDKLAERFPTLRSFSDAVLAAAGNAVELESKLDGVNDLLTRIAAVGGEGSQSFPVSQPRQFGRAAPASPATPSGRSGRTPADVEADQLRRRAAALLTQSLTPLEAYGAKLDEVDQLLAKHALTQEQAAKVKLGLAQDLADQQAKLEEQRLADFQRSVAEEIAIEQRRGEELARLQEQTQRDRERQARIDEIYMPGPGAVAALQEMADESRRWGEIVGEGISYGADVGAAALSSFVLEGKTGIKDLAKTVQAELVEGAFSMLVRGLVGNLGLAAIGAFGGGATPAAAAGPTPLFGGFKAAGGPVRSDRWYWVGENGPERFLPNVPGTIVPAGGGGMTIVNQVIDQRQAGAPPIEQSQSRGPNGEMILRTVVRDEMKKAVASGSLDRELGGRFGARPQPRR